MNKKLNAQDGHKLALILILILIIMAGYLKIKEVESVRTIENGYDRAFYELIGYTDNVETLLAKSQISNTPEYSAKTLTEIWRETNLASVSLSQIPIKHIVLENTVKFLNQTGDYSYSLSRKTIEKEKLSEEEFKNLNMLYTNCKTLNSNLRELASDMSGGGVSWSELTNTRNSAMFAQEVANLSQDSFGNIEKDLQEYEGLIYDGPFSNHMTSPEPKGLGSEVYNEEMAKQKIREYIDEAKIREIKYNGLVNGNIITHDFNVILNNDALVYMSVTEQGGHVLCMNYDRNVEEIKLDIEQANQKALDFLNGHGYTNMKESYYINEAGTLTINYAYVQNGVICYPDLIKVKVAMDDGEITGIESTGYLNAHTKREIATPKISMKEAKSKINSKMQIMSKGLAIVPTDWSTEVLTYEFKGKIDENEFIVYINAETGKEENIFMIVNTPNGILAV